MKVFTFLLLMSGGLLAQEIKYEEAYDRHNVLDEPLVVVLTTSPCAACDVVKNRLKKIGQRFVVLDTKDEFAKEFVMKPTAPTTIVFKRGRKLVVNGLKKIEEVFTELKD